MKYVAFWFNFQISFFPFNVLLLYYCVHKVPRPQNIAIVLKGEQIKVWEVLMRWINHQRNNSSPCVNLEGKSYILQILVEDTLCRGLNNLAKDTVPFPQVPRILQMKLLIYNF
jgi:hypothetical protein